MNCFALNDWYKSLLFLCLCVLALSSCGGSSEAVTPIESLSVLSDVGVSSTLQTSAHSGANSDLSIAAPAPTLGDSISMPTQSPVADAPSDPSIAATALGDKISVSTQSRFAGAISSLMFRGKEYIDISDHGREMQSASSFDQLGECYNPTEAGSRDDGSGATSSSRLLSVSKGLNWLETETDMAFWLSPGTDYLRTTNRTCGDQAQVTQAVNSTVTANHLLKKRVEIGYAGQENVINYQAEFKVPESRMTATFEAATVYTPKYFANRLTLDPVSGKLQPTDMQGEQALPVILGSADEQHAIGVYSANLPRNGLGYGTFSFADTNKINCVFRETNILPQSYRYQCIFAVGTLKEVSEAIMALYKNASSLAATP